MESTLIALLILVLVAGIAFWLVGKIPTSDDGPIPPIVKTILYVVVIALALIRLFGMI